MSTISVSERIEEVSPRTKARMAGGFYLATILTGVFTQQFISHLCRLQRRQGHGTPPVACNTPETPDIGPIGTLDSRP
jgi:hypothetical protein